MFFLLKYIRYIILTATILLALLLYFFSIGQYTNLSALYAELGQDYALLAVALIYFSLIITPIYFVFPKLPFKPIAIKSRRALGVSAFIFALMHALLEFFKVFGGFGNIKYLNSSYLLSFLLGLIALVVLAAMTATSLNYAVKKMGKYWKILHRFIYLAGFLVVFHVYLIGSDFVKFFDLGTIAYTLALMFLLFLESIRLNFWLVRKYPTLKPKIIFSILTVLIILFVVSLYFLKVN